MSSTEASKISRLHDEQQKAVSETEETIRQIEKYRAEYKALQKRLKTLPDNVTHNVMVPFGKLAFMPGQIVHTNEILVLLGDNWFAERSALQACDIADRRIKELDRRLAELREQRSLLEPRLRMTSELQDIAEGKGDFMEIVEEYDGEKERLWDEQHKLNVRRHHETMREMREASKLNERLADSESKMVSLNKSDEDLWSRLDALERQEEKRGELNSSFDSEDSESIDKDTLSASNKRVNWMDKEIRKYEDSSNDDDDDDNRNIEDDDDDENSANEVEPQKKIIHFRHTKKLSPVHNESQASSSSVHDGAIPRITSPADITKLLSVKSILKKTTKSSPSSHTVVSSDKDVDHLAKVTASEDNQGLSSFKDTSSVNKTKAFTGIVRETPAENLSTPSTGVITLTDPQVKPKQISKFRAQKMGGNSS